MIKYVISALMKFDTLNQYLTSFDYLNVYMHEYCFRVLNAFLLRIEQNFMCKHVFNMKIHSVLSRASVVNMYVEIF